MRVRPSLIQAERVDWASLRCGCGKSGAHIPETFVVGAVAVDGEGVDVSSGRSESSRCQAAPSGGLRGLI